MKFVLLACISMCGMTGSEVTPVNRSVGYVLGTAARVGVPPPAISWLFGAPTIGIYGRSDWRTNPDRYIWGGYSRYGVSVEWEAGQFPKVEFGPEIGRFHGSSGN
jgi:hypothetical protein